MLIYRFNKTTNCFGKPTNGIGKTTNSFSKTTNCFGKTSNGLCQSINTLTLFRHHFRDTRDCSREFAEILFYPIQLRLHIRIVYHYAIY